MMAHPGQTPGGRCVHSLPANYLCFALKTWATFFCHVYSCHLMQISVTIPAAKWVCLEDASVGEGTE